MKQMEIHETVILFTLEYIGNYRIKIGDEMAIRILRDNVKNLKPTAFSVLSHKMFFYCITDSPAVDFYWRPRCSSTTM